jgi:hypothetical protein
MGEGDNTDSTGSFGGAWGTSTPTEGYAAPTLSPDLTGDTLTTGRYGSDSTAFFRNYTNEYSPEGMLGPDGEFGEEALAGNPYKDGKEGPTSTDVDFSALDWLKGKYMNYRHIIDPAMRFGGLLSPHVAIAGALKDLFLNPQNAIAGRVGSGLGQAIGGAALGPAGAILGGQFGGGLASGYANDATRGYSNYNMPEGMKTSSNTPDYSLLASGLLGLKAANDFKSQKNDLQSLYGQNSPYAQQLRQTLQRDDARAGRRSQVGSREVELQARLADVNSRNAPQIQQLSTNQRLAQLSTLRDLAYFGKQSGGLGNLFGGGGGQQPTTQPSWTDNINGYA